MSSSVHAAPQDHVFNGIDVIKFVCAFLIVMIHVDPFQTNALGLQPLNFWIKDYICRIAVPFYFVSSGFLLFRKTDLYDLDVDRIKTYVFRMIRLLGIWTVLLFRGGHEHLWYMGAVVTAVILLSILLKKGVKLGVIAAISLSAYAVGLFGDAYYGLIKHLVNYPVTKVIIVGFDNLIVTTRTGLFFGFVLVLMGALFAQRRIVINRFAAVAGLVLSFAALFLEVFLLRKYTEPKDYNMMGFLLPAVFFLFYLSSHIQLKNRPIYARLRVIGLLVYFIHMFVDYFVDRAIAAAAQLGPDFSAFHFMTTVCLTVILAVLIENLSRKDRFSWLKYLYS